MLNVEKDIINKAVIIIILILIGCLLIGYAIGSAVIKNKLESVDKEPTVSELLNRVK